MTDQPKTLEHCGPRTQARVLPLNPRTADEVPEVLDVRRASHIVGLSPSTLNTLRSRGGGPPYVKMGRRVFYRVSEFAGVEGCPAAVEHGRVSGSSGGLADSGCWAGTQYRLAVRCARRGSRLPRSISRERFHGVRVVPGSPPKPAMRVGVPICDSRFGLMMVEDAGHERAALLSSWGCIVVAGENGQSAEFVQPIGLRALADRFQTAALTVWRTIGESHFPRKDAVSTGPRWVQVGSPPVPDRRI